MPKKTFLGADGVDGVDGGGDGVVDGVVVADGVNGVDGVDDGVVVVVVVVATKTFSKPIAFVT